ncbi:acetyl/propionyl/methylcrotonyl-CoA carboxylase subunit alpha [Verticiella sediminum]|uniref:Acetyl/propionyl/methylcrotonyl-CoA carboxylase subunit alpha n=1 Tax=Verticiella sediminum TaxID=1247510 RepID=A0A556AL49_9BURK|nr:acetyl/propionyl/methylcrotonyl-CoA carboxylase subunit alpha [Verticiella sediminum]TSH93614.1 acetyl/propionyl/methylcrotonyl-CoA carboxylase subunit alpha [Verticiella sediminum]
MFHTLLIANRGEIACRVAATARRLGIRTVAVYSDADAGARHVAACDEAVRIGGPAARDSYLRADAVLDAARRTGAQAIHPGYGFLSENEAFARACADAGIVFVGPPASAIAAMGSKSAAKALMERAGVPLVPGYHGDTQEAEFLHARADEIGYPVLIKASAGGGGKGMRVVESSTAFTGALASCRREAAASFGDDQVLIERYLQKPRHIEIQVFADTQGNCLYLFERDCSVQRRHQKVIEEAPAPGMTGERRRAMGEAAVAAARAVGYVGAGTVEFIAEPDGRFYFMEMNTRLQVEHPVTEMVCGHDLVEWQLRVAAGEPLPCGQEALRLHGHAIEARIYAENADKGFLPSVGRLQHLRLPAHVAFTVGADAGEPAAVRVDGGVRAGDAITPYYDPMIAKLIVWGRDRDEARRRMRQALGQTEIAGVHTNVAFLARLMDDEAFAQADLDTGLIERRKASLQPRPAPAPSVALALGAAGLLRQQARAAACSPDPWDIADDWRPGGAASRVLELIDQGDTRRIQVDAAGLRLDEQPATPFAWLADDPACATVRVTLGGQTASGTVLVGQTGITVFHDARRYTFSLPDPAAGANEAAGAGHLAAPMPGKIIAVHANPGDTVKAGQALVVMEAMKMEHTITAPAAGKVAAVRYAPGDQVAEGAELIELTLG